MSTTLFVIEPSGEGNKMPDMNEEARDRIDFTDHANTKACLQGLSEIFSPLLGC